MSSNLLHSCSHVQQLLVREIFLLGMSDGTPSIRDLTFLEQIALRMRSSHSRGVESSRQRQPHLLQYPALGQNLVVEND